MKQRNRYHKGVVDGWMISTIGLIVLVLGFGSLAIWAYMNYNEAKTDLEGKTALAKAEAKKEQADEDEQKFAEREKEPRREFSSPDEYGRLSFTYPKTWSVYVDKDPTASGATTREYVAYLHPVVVPPVGVRDQRFAVRVSILNENYDTYLKKYDRFLKDGKLKSTTINVDGDNAVRLDGNFSDTIRGSAIIFKIRDKTAIVQTDADTFKHDYNALIKTITFIK